MIRLLVILLILLLALLCSKSFGVSYEIRRKRFIQYVSVILILQSGLRNWAVGSDTYQYYKIFTSVEQDSWQSLLKGFINREGKDPFYALFQKSFQFFLDNYQLYLMLVAIIFMSSLGYFIFRNTTKIRHALLAYIIYLANFYLFFSITGIRQTIATAILIYSLEYIKKRKLIHFISLVIIAALFHITALVFLPLYFVSEIKKSKLIFATALLGFPLFMIFKNQLAVFFVSFVNAEDRFGSYTEQYERGGSYILTCFHVLLGVWALSIIQKVIKLAPATYRMYNIFAVGLFFFPLQWVNPNAGRIAQYFTVIMMVWIPYLLDASSIGKPQLKEFLYLVTIIMFIILSLFAITWNEYAFFWQEMALPYQ